LIPSTEEIDSPAWGEDSGQQQYPHQVPAEDTGVDPEEASTV